MPQQIRNRRFLIRMSPQYHCIEKRLTVLSGGRIFFCLGIALDPATGGLQLTWGQGLWAGFGWLAPHRYLHFFCVYYEMYFCFVHDVEIVYIMFYYVIYIQFILYILFELIMFILFEHGLLELLLFSCCTHDERRRD